MELAYKIISALRKINFYLNLKIIAIRKVLVKGKKTENSSGVSLNNLENENQEPKLLNQRKTKRRVFKETFLYTLKESCFYSSAQAIPVIIKKFNCIKSWI